MTHTATSSRPRPPLVAILRYTLRACLAGRRATGILVACVATLLFGLLASTMGGTDERAFAAVSNLGLFGLVLPVTCLVIGDAVLGAEVRSGSFAFTWLSPVPTWQIAVGRWFGGTVVAATGLGVSFALAAVIASTPESAGPVAAGAATGAAAYIAIFLAIGCVARRAAAWSLAFVFLFERLMGAALAGIAQLSPTWLSQAVFLGLAGGPEEYQREGIPQGGAAIVRLAILTVIALVISSRRLHTLRLSGSSD
jgi:ABC-type transport system involved in multi-copper enzyme maturation permease subunit